MCSFFIFLFFNVFAGPRSIFGAFGTLRRTSDDSVHGFQNHGGIMVACAPQIYVLFTLVTTMKYQEWIPDFQLWEAGTNLGGGVERLQLLMRFGENVCQNDRIGSY